MNHSKSLKFPMKKANTFERYGAETLGERFRGARFLEVRAFPMSIAHSVSFHTLATNIIDAHSSETLTLSSW